MNDLIEAKLIASLRTAEALEGRTDLALIDATVHSTEAKKLVIAATKALDSYRATRAKADAFRVETQEIRRQRDAARLSLAFNSGGEA